MHYDDWVQPQVILVVLDIFAGTVNIVKWEECFAAVVVAAVVWDLTVVLVPRVLQHLLTVVQLVVAVAPVVVVVVVNWDRNLNFD